jgi:hypothetical protein
MTIPVTMLDRRHSDTDTRTTGREVTRRLPEVSGVTPAGVFGHATGKPFATRRMF